MTTSELIIEKVAPVFNKKGYVGTSLSDLTEVTRLTKGAIYCNFRNKEELAVKAFKFNVRKVISPLSKEIEKQNTALDKLFAITRYYRNYYALSLESGGCPILNVGVDTKYVNPHLFNEVKRVTTKLVQGLVTIIEDGIKAGEIRQDTNARLCATNIFAMIEGAVFMAFSYEDEECMGNAMDFMDAKIIEELRA